MVRERRPGRVEARRTRLAPARSRAQTDGVPVSSYHYLEGPLIAVAALGVIVLVCRWVFSTDHRTARPSTPTGEPDFGLLQSIRAAGSAQEAAALRAVLVEAGIRCTVTPRGQTWDVLVFASDADRARALV